MKLVRNLSLADALFAVGAPNDRLPQTPVKP